MDVKKAFSDLVFTEKRGMAVESSVSMFSQMFHFVSFELRKPRTQFDAAMLIFSVDVDAGCRKLGEINAGKNDANVHLCFTESQIGDIEARAVPVLTKAFNDFAVPATFAIRGQMADVSDTVMELLLKSPVKHDIGAHGYSHRNFQTLSRKEAAEELRMTALALGKFGVAPQSFVFPRNHVAHLDLLEEFGYKCYREGAGSLFGDGMYIEKKGNLFNIQPSLYLNNSVTPLILEGILEVAIAKKAPLHLWFHPWTFGDSQTKIMKYVQGVLSPFLKHAAAKKKNGSLTFETMLSASKKAQKILGDTN